MPASFAALPVAAMLEQELICLPRSSFMTMVWGFAINRLRVGSGRRHRRGAAWMRKRVAPLERRQVARAPSDDGAVVAPEGDLAAGAIRCVVLVQVIVYDRRRTGCRWSFR